MRDYSKFNASNVLENVEKRIKELEMKNYRFRYYISDVCDELNIFDWYTDWLSKSQLLDMRKFLKEAIKLGYNGYVCFMVGAVGCINGMWASKQESLDGYSPEGDYLSKSFTSEYNRWKFKYNGIWYGGDKKILKTIRELEKLHNEIIKEK